MIVDEVKEVVNLSEDEIEKSTNKGGLTINGIGKHGDDLDLRFSRLTRWWMTTHKHTEDVCVA